MVLSRISSVLQGNVGEKFTAYVNLKLMDKAQTLSGLELLEDNRFHDDLELRQSGSTNRHLNTLMMLTFTGRSLITLASMAALLSVVGTLRRLIRRSAVCAYDLTFRSSEATF